MKKTMTILLPVGLLVFATGIFAFTSHNNGEDDKKKKECKVKIIKEVDGVKTVIDSTFDCSTKDFDWHAMIPNLNIKGDSGKCEIICLTEGVHGDMMKLHLDGENLEEMLKNLDIDMEDLHGELMNIEHIIDEDGNITISMDGEEGDPHKKMKVIQLKGGEGEMNEEIEVMIENLKEGNGEEKMIKIMSTTDEDGNVTIKKFVNGEEVEFDENDENHKVIIKTIEGKDAKVEMKQEVIVIHGDGEHGEDVNVEVIEGKHAQCIVMIKSLSSEDSEKMAKQVPAAKDDFSKKELAVDELKFSPNPNNGQFDLSFELNSKSPVEVKVMDMQGKVVYNETMDNFKGKYKNRIDISENGKGIYILQIIQGDKAHSSKVIIK